MTKSYLEELLAIEMSQWNFPFKREYRFHPGRRWRFDFAFPDFKIGVEIEGGTGSGKSRHTSAKGYEADCVKYNTATMMGWRVLRFTSSMVRRGEAGILTLELLNRERNNGQGKAHSRPARGSTESRRQTLPQGQGEADSRGEGVPEEGESPTP